MGAVARDPHSPPRALAAALRRHDRGQETPREPPRTARAGRQPGGAIRKLSWKPSGTEWGDYYAGTNYSDAARDRKMETVREFITRARPATVWDLGANTGEFSRLASDQGDRHGRASTSTRPRSRRTIGVCASAPETRILPLVMDLTNPSPALGWDHDERCVLGRARPRRLGAGPGLIHHLAISNNVPL